MSQPSAIPNLKWVRRVSTFLDSKFTIPFTKVKFGLDPIFSIIPGLGDLGTYAVALVIIYTVRKNGASGNVITKMLLNSTLDTIVGSIPVLGTVFDVFYRSNERNLRLVEEHYEEGKHQGSGKGLLTLVVVGVVLVFVTLIYLAFLMLKKLLEFLA
jgi:hypothetical protein